jgi:imidazolonepropionase-like amidohydrolase
VEKGFQIAPSFAVVNAKVFDGEERTEASVVVVTEGKITSLGGPVPSHLVVVDARGGTLLPGFIDSHVHTNMEGLKDALKFGVTTELEMNGHWSAKARREVTRRKDLADLRTSMMGVTAKKGHPSQYMRTSTNLLIRLLYPLIDTAVSTGDQAVKHVSKQVANGADYVKVFIEDGTCVGFPGLPVLDDATLRAAVNEAHRLGKLVLAHVTTLEGATSAIEAGVDGLAHMFFDRPPTPEFVSALLKSGAFVVPTLVTISSAVGNTGADLASDPRVQSRLSKTWLESLARTMNVYPQGKFGEILSSVRTLHDAGVDILAGCDVSEPLPTLGGLAHGASLHQELRLLVEAGLTPLEVLRSVTSVPARRFGLTDRGRIAVGTRADLLMVEGDPLANIADTLSIKAVWREGVRLAE